MMKNRHPSLRLSLVVAFAMAAFSMPAYAQPDEAPAGTASYDDCVALIDNDPAKALAYAQRMEKQTGGVAAMHCKGLALAALGRHEEAGEVLYDLAERIPFADETARAEVYAQAADDFMQADNHELARLALDGAIERDPTMPDYRVTRARLRALDKDWTGVRDDLSEALAENPNLVSALTLRASANRLLGYPKAALVDTDHAVGISPHNLDALLERGRVRSALGNVAGARTDWEDLIRFAKETGRSSDPAAQLATSYLAEAPSSTTP